MNYMVIITNELGETVEQGFIEAESFEDAKVGAQSWATGPVIWDDDSQDGELIEGTFLLCESRPMCISVERFEGDTE